LVPKSSSLLFYPKSRRVSIVNNNCPEQVPDFVARTGLFISGSVSPGVAGVSIDVIQVKDNTKIMTVETDAQGKYSAGPLYDDNEYKVNATKDGYTLIKKEDSKYDFIATQLSSISVMIQDSDGAPLSGVFISLSGVSQYRQSSISPENGSLSFNNLIPGDYFLQYDIIQ
jgi:hypothetical protein